MLLHTEWKGPLSVAASLRHAAVPHCNINSAARFRTSAVCVLERKKLIMNGVCQSGRFQYSSTL